MANKQTRSFTVWDALGEYGGERRRDKLLEIRDGGGRRRVLRKLWAPIKIRLASGKLTATRVDDSPTEVPIPAGAWENLSIWLSPRPMDLPADQRLWVVTGKGKELHGVRIEGPRVLPGTPEGADRARWEAKDWIMDRLAAGTLPLKGKEKARAEAMAEIPGLSERAFDDMWAVEVPPNYKAPGAPKITAPPTGKRAATTRKD